MNLTNATGWDYSVLALAKSSVRIGTLNLRSPSGLTRSTLFLRPKSMVGCYRHLRVAALRSGSSNLYQPAASRLEPFSGRTATAITETIMDELIPFDFNSHPVRAFQKNSIIWFIAKDICDALDYKHVPSAMRYLDDDEKGVSNKHTPGGKQSVTIINESGLYHLILKSRKPEAKYFRKWVTSEVLPAIRKTGKYESAQPAIADSLMEQRYVTYVNKGKIIGMRHLSDKVFICDTSEPSQIVDLIKWYADEQSLPRVMEEGAKKLRIILEGKQ